MKYLTTLIRILFLALFIYLVASGRMMLWLALYAASLAAAPLFGRIYCGYACPMNTVMIPAEWLSKKLKLQTPRTPGWLRSGFFAWISLAGSVAATVIAQRLLHRAIPVLVIWLALSVLITLRYPPVVFHNLVCPFGPLQKAFGRFARRSETVDQASCIGCRRCEKVCPSLAISVGPERKAAIDRAACLQCTSCRQVCPKGSIGYGRT